MKKNKANQIKSMKKKKTIHKFPKKSRVGPFLTATFTAVLIGLFLGLLMLNMFTNKEKHASTNDHQQAASDADDIDKAETKPTTLKQMKAYVLQLGVFSEKENANDWSETYQQEGVTSVHFHRDNQYFLFSGMADTEERAKEFAAILLKDGIEVYVKEWITNEIDAELTGTESEWLASFQEQWEKSLMELSKEDGVLLDGWNKLIEEYPLKSEGITQLVEAIELLSENEGKSIFELQNHLLNIWKVYEESYATN